MERQIAALRQRLKSVEQQAASESAAHEDQARLAETMARAARAEAREREALTRANAELAALVRSMEDELNALKSEHGADPERAPDRGRETREPAESEAAPVPEAESVCESGDTAADLTRLPIQFPRFAIVAMCLAAVVAGAMSYALVAAFTNGADGPVTGRATVIAGDTIRVDGITIRLLGIDAPPAGTMAGERAVNYLRRLTAGQDVRCEADGRRAGVDALARCFIGAVDIGQVMMLSGNAVLRQSALRPDHPRQ